MSDGAGERDGGDVGGGCGGEFGGGDGDDVLESKVGRLQGIKLMGASSGEDGPQSKSCWVCLGCSG